LRIAYKVGLIAKVSIKPSRWSVFGWALALISCHSGEDVLHVRTIMKTKHSLLATSGFALSVLASTLFIPGASAQTAAGLIGAWGKTCKMRVVSQFDVPMSDAFVSVGATLQQSIDQGETTLADIKKQGLVFNWEIRGKKVNGYCSVNGKGKITEFKQAI
jgi:hypothetical protein